MAWAGLLYWFSDSSSRAALSVWPWPLIFVGFSVDVLGRMWPFALLRLWVLKVSYFSWWGEFFCSWLSGVLQFLFHG